MDNPSDDMRRPILVTGMARSGTTWVARILNASGQTGIIGEPLNLEPAAGVPRISVPHWYTYISEENEGPYVLALQRLLRFEHDHLGDLRRARSAADVGRVAGTWARFLRSRRRRPLVKEPHASMSARWFAERLACDVVVTVRRPAAVVSSWKRLGWSFDMRNLLDQPLLMRDWLAPFEREMTGALDDDSDLVDRAALLWKLIYYVLRRHEQASPRVVVVRHEDLSRTPTEAFASLFERLGLELSARAMQRIESSTASTNPHETPIDDPHLTRLDSQANLESWRARLTEAEIARIREVTDDVAREYYDETER